MSINQKILVIQTSFLGDVILSLPMVQSLKTFMPGSEIDYICIPSTANVLQGNPHLRNVIIYDKKAANKITRLKEIISKVRKEKYDIVICPHRSLRSALITYLSRAELRIGFDKNTLSFLLTERAAYKKEEHEIKRNIELIKLISEIDFKNERLSLKPELFPTVEDRDIVSKLLNSFSPAGTNKIISFAPCSKWFTKNMPEHKSIEIVNSTISAGYKVVLVAGNDDEKYCSSVAKQALDVKSVINLAGKLTPVQSSFAIQQSCVLITVDSAAAHLGAATNTPIIMIYGSTIPAFGFYPLTSKNIIIENNNLDCRPCTDHGRGSCPLKHFKCMNDLKTVEIIKAVETLLNQK